MPTKEICRTTIIGLKNVDRYLTSCINACRNKCQRRFDKLGCDIYFIVQSKYYIYMIFPIFGLMHSFYTVVWYFSFGYNDFPLGYCIIAQVYPRLYSGPFHGVNQNTANRHISYLLQWQQPIISSDFHRRHFESQKRGHF